MSLEKRIGGDQTLLDNRGAILHEVTLMIKETETTMFYYLSVIVLSKIPATLMHKIMHWVTEFSNL